MLRFQSYYQLKSLSSVYLHVHPTFQPFLRAANLFFCMQRGKNRGSMIAVVGPKWHRMRVRPPLCTAFIHSFIYISDPISDPIRVTRCTKFNTSGTTLHIQYHICSVLNVIPPFVTAPAPSWCMWITDSRSPILPSSSRFIGPIVQYYEPRVFVYHHSTRIQDTENIWRLSLESIKGQKVFRRVHDAALVRNLGGQWNSISILSSTSSTPGEFLT